MRLTNCKNCGAPLKNYKCDYCGSEYEYVHEISDFEQVITLFIGGRKRKFYISTVTREPVVYETTCCLDGTRTHVRSMNDNITLELISYD